jgi:GNAT superfamily N-acetyltransferase
VERPEIRRALASEAAALTALAVRSKAHWGYDEAFMAGVMPELALSAERLEASTCFVAVLGETLAGYYVLALEDGEPTLCDLWVDPPAMGQRVGAALVAHMRAEARARGWPVVRIVSDPNAEAFYLKVGARRVGSVASKVLVGRVLPVMEVESGGAGTPTPSRSTR